MQFCFVDVERYQDVLFVYGYLLSHNMVFVSQYSSRLITCEFRHGGFAFSTDTFAHEDFFDGEE